MNINLFALIIRVSSIFIFIYSLNYIVGNISMLSYNFRSQGGWPMTVYITLAFPFIISIILWFFPVSIAKSLIPKTNNVTKLSDVPIDEIQILVFQSIGLFLLVTSLGGIFETIIYYDRLEYSPVSKGIAAYVVIKVIISLWLLFGSRGIVGLLRLAREVGRK